MTSAGSGVSMWPTAFTVAGTRWQSVHAIGLKNRMLGARGLWGAPTPRAVGAVLPRVSFGGALPPAEPWHELHGWSVVTSRLPSMWRAGSVITRPPPGVIVGWHLPQSLSLGCGGGGGVPSHDPHWLCAPLPPVQFDCVAVPPAGPLPSLSVAP